MSSTGSNPAPVPPASQADPKISAKRQLKQKNAQDFWRATRYLMPYRGLVIASVISALFVGVAMAGGFTAMLPILRVLINGDTVPNWVNRQIVQKRLGVTFAADTPDLRVISMKAKGIAAAAGVQEGDALSAKNPDAETVILWQLSDPAATSSTITREHGGSVTFTGLPAPPLYYAPIRPMLTRYPIQPVAAVAIVLAIGVTISFVGNCIRFVQEYYSDKAAILAINDIRRRLYDHVLHVPMTYFGLQGTSDVTSRLVQDCQALQDGFKQVLGPSIQMPVNALVAFAVAMKISWKLTLFITLFAPVMVGIIQKFGKKMRRASRKALQRSSSLLGQIEGTLSGIRVVKGANAERFERRRYTGIMSGLTAEQLRMSRIDAISSPTVEVSTLLVVCIIVLWATRLVRLTHELSAEDFVVVMACLAMIGESLRRLGKLNAALQRSGAAAARVFETLAVPVERPRHMVGRDERPKIVLPPVDREIRFENVTFGYANTTSPALVDVNLTVKRGESVAIVGRNGSGKTTLLALLPRFYDPQEGRVLIDGVDVKDSTLKSVRDQISIVTQDSVIFAGTIAENIAYGHPLAGTLKDDTPTSRELRAQIEHAAKRAFAHDFILEKPQGYDTELGGLGGALSGGQKQRINIARAIFRATPILVLDEATSQVDAESEHLIQKAIEGLIHDRTTFVIAHRFSTILSADRIIVMDRGQIVGMGRHEELQRTCQTYVNLYERQLPPSSVQAEVTTQPVASGDEELDRDTGLRPVLDAVERE
jgi:ABC-type multidrug transport system fused ATPase/permease subunit